MLSEEKRLKTKAQLKDWLNYELQYYYRRGGKGCRLVHISETSILAYHQILLRKTEYYYNTGKKIRMMLYKIALKRCQNKYGMNIPLNCCERGLKIFHIGPILINPKAVVGKDCAFHLNSALTNKGTGVAAPVLDDGVLMGIGAVAMGDIYIAKNVIVGANAVVNKSIEEENVAIAGVPAKKISNQGRRECDNPDKDR